MSRNTKRDIELYKEIERITEEERPKTRALLVVYLCFICLFRYERLLYCYLL